MSLGDKIKNRMPEDVKRIWVVVVGSVLCIATLVFAFYAIALSIATYYYDAATSIFLSFIFLGLFRFLSFFIYKDKKVERIRAISLLGYSLFNGLLFILAPYTNYILYGVAFALYAMSIIISRIFKILAYPKDKLRLPLNIITIAFGAVVIALSIAFLALRDEQTLGYSCMFLTGLLIAINAILEVSVIAFAQIKLKLLFKIIRKTFAIEILFALLTLMVTFSLLLMVLEDKFANYGDALWYCFAIVTTIGFGDYTATSVLGRILSVILGCFGIITVAVITSIIVNFYSETANNKNSDKIEDIEKQITTIEEKVDNEEKQVQEVLKTEQDNIEETKTTKKKKENK